MYAIVIGTFWHNLLRCSDGDNYCEGGEPNSGGDVCDTRRCLMEIVVVAIPIDNHIIH